MNQNTKHAFHGLGTPKDINEMVMHILCFRPPEGKTPDQWVHGILRDYLAQKFNVVMFKCHTPEQEALIKELWLSIMGEESGVNNEKK